MACLLNLAVPLELFPILFTRMAPCYSSDFSLPVMYLERVGLATQSN